MPRLGKFPLAAEIEHLILSVQRTFDVESAGVLLFVGANGKGAWGYQIGNDHTGEAYRYPHWGQYVIYDSTDPKKAAGKILREIRESYEASR